MGLSTALRAILNLAGSVGSYTQYNQRPEVRSRKREYMNLLRLGNTEMRNIRIRPKIRQKLVKRWHIIHWWM